VKRTWRQRVETIWPVCVGILPALGGAQEVKSRVITHAELPAIFRESLSVHGVTRQTGARIDTVRGSPASLSVATNQLLAVHVGDRPTYVAAPLTSSIKGRPAPETVRGHYVLPTRYLATDAAAATTLVLRPIYVSGAPLAYVPAEHLFRGDLLIGVEDSASPSVAVTLAKPIEFQFAGDADTLSPAALEVNHTNLPLDTVKVSATNPGDSVRVHIVPELDPNGIDIWLHVAPVLTFLEIPGQVEGLGLEDAVVVVGIVGTTIRDTALVTLTTTDGTFESSQVKLGPGGTTTAHLRSRGIGPVTLSAIAPGLDAVTGTVTFVFPWMFLIAALLGGTFGGTVKWLNGPTHTSSAWAATAVRGAAVGAIAAIVYYAIRVNLLPVTIDIQYLNEAAVFALALLAGLFGIKAPTA
jgi:hypothetical protein